jgi:hypothetical protein
MSYSVSEIKNELAGVLHGTTINKITNLAGLMNRAGRQLLLDCNPIETKRIVQLGQVFNDVYDYASPTDLKGVQVIDIRPQAGRYPSDQYEQAYARWFDANKNLNWNNSFNVQHNTGVKSLRIEAPAITTPLVITDTGSTTGWSVFGGASSLSVDTQFNVAGSGALTFNIDGVSEGGVKNTTITPIDMSEHEGVSTLFLWVYMPTAATAIGDDLVTLWWGSSETDFWSYTASAQQDGTAFKNGWNLVAFPWNADDVSGSPDSSSITFVKVFIFPTTPQTGYKICNLTSGLPKYMEMVYYSKYLFSNGGVWKETITDTDSADLTTIVNLDTESYGLYFNLLAYYVCQQMMGKDAQKDSQFFLKEYQRSLARYTSMYKSETLLPSEPWYRLPTQRTQTGPRWVS